jgi:hypothetical protein
MLTESAEQRELARRHVSAVQRWVQREAKRADVVFLDKKSAVRWGDLRTTLKVALGMVAVGDALREQGRDEGRRTSSLLIDALDDRTLMSALERVGGRVELVTLSGGERVWRFQHPEHAQRHHADLRSLLADVRRECDDDGV